MDSSYWTKLNPNIVCEATRKQFYNRFCYKLVLEVFAARCINDIMGNQTVKDYILYRKNRDQYQYSYGGSWFKKHADEMSKADPVFIEELISIKNGYGNRIKFRVEEPWVQIYAEDEQTLRDIVARFDRQSLSRILSVSVPTSPEHQAYLEEGNILISPTSKIDYDYKVMLRDGTYGVAVKTNLANYFKTLGDDVKVSKANMSMLEGELTFIWGCYFYTNDPAIATMVQLMAPGMVGKIHKLVRT